MSVVIKNMDMPTNCAHCPCLSVDSEGVKCGTPDGKGQRICSDSLYFDNWRPKFCPMEGCNDKG